MRGFYRPAQLVSKYFNLYHVVEAISLNPNKKRANQIFYLRLVMNTFQIKILEFKLKLNSE